MKTEGWNWLWNSRRWHYFVDGRSLCGRFLLLGDNGDAQGGNDNSPDNCKSCRTRLAARNTAELSRAKVAPEEPR